MPLKIFSHVYIISENKRSRIAKSVEKKFCKVFCCKFFDKKVTELIVSGINFCF